MMQLLRQFRSLGYLSSLLGLGLAACGGGGGGGGTPSVPAQVPSGSGRTTIQMVGTWEIRAATVIESNDPQSLPPLNGTRIEIGFDGIERINGFSVARADLEAVVGFPLTWYFNQADGRTIIYGANFDRIAQGGTMEQVGLAGGSLNDNMIAVEQFNGRRLGAQEPEYFTRSRYTLVRVGGLSAQLPAAAAIGGVAAPVEAPIETSAEAAVEAPPVPAERCLGDALPGLLPR
jgi:hypothetical protein